MLLFAGFGLLIPIACVDEREPARAVASNGSGTANSIPSHGDAGARRRLDLDGARTEHQVDLGEMIDWNGAVSFRLALLNEGRDTLQTSLVQTTCACLVVEDARDLEPGEADDVRLLVTTHERSSVDALMLIPRVDGGVERIRVVGRVRMPPTLLVVPVVGASARGGTEHAIWALADGHRPPREVNAMVLWADGSVSNQRISDFSLVDPEDGTRFPRFRALLSLQGDKREGDAFIRVDAPGWQAHGQRIHVARSLN